MYMKWDVIKKKTTEKYFYNPIKSLEKIRKKS